MFTLIQNQTNNVLVNGKVYIHVQCFFITLVGILCGDCPEGVSVLFNKCVTCDNTNALLIPLLGNRHCMCDSITICFTVLIEILVVIAVILIDKPLPLLLYPFLFYLQVIAIIVNNFLNEH